MEGVVRVVWLVCEEVVLGHTEVSSEADEHVLVGSCLIQIGGFDVYVIDSWT